MVRFDHFKEQAGQHISVLSVSEWIEQTNAVALFGFLGKTLSEMIKYRTFAPPIISCSWRYFLVIKKKQEKVIEI